MDDETLVAELAEIAKNPALPESLRDMYRLYSDKRRAKETEQESYSSTAGRLLEGILDIPQEAKRFRALQEYRSQTLAMIPAARRHGDLLETKQLVARSGGIDRLREVFEFPSLRATVDWIEERCRWWSNEARNLSDLVARAEIESAKIRGVGSEQAQTVTRRAPALWDDDDAAWDRFVSALQEEGLIRGSTVPMEWLENNTIVFCELYNRMKECWKHPRGIMAPGTFRKLFTVRGKTPGKDTMRSWFNSPFRKPADTLLVDRILKAL